MTDKYHITFCFIKKWLLYIVVHSSQEKNGEIYLTINTQTKSWVLKGKCLSSYLCFWYIKNIHPLFNCQQLEVLAYYFLNLFGIVITFGATHCILMGYNKQYPTPNWPNKIKCVKYSLWYNGGGTTNRFLPCIVKESSQYFVPESWLIAKRYDLI